MKWIVLKKLLALSMLIDTSSNFDQIVKFWSIFYCECYAYIINLRLCSSLLCSICYSTISTEGYQI